MAYSIGTHSTDKEVLNDVNKIPDKCPACGKGIEPIYCYQFGVDTWSAYEGFLQIVFRCPRKDCQRLFIAYYATEKGFGNTILLLQNIYILQFAENEEFPASIKNISPNFINIYFESETAETNKLMLIAGPGYRKALEFLIKDYLIKTNPKIEVDVKKEQLGVAIKRIENKKIEACASRAAWLGNDETHYVRKWENKDINDLKVLIKMVVDWIDLLELSDEYESAMPSPESP